jgi:hypothetical protein
MRHRASGGAKRARASREAAQAVQREERGGDAHERGAMALSA